MRVSYLGIYRCNVINFFYLSPNHGGAEVGVLFPAPPLVKSCIHPRPSCLNIIVVYKYSKENNTKGEIFS